MNKEVKKISNLIADIEKRRAAAEAELRASDEKLTALKSLLATAADEEQFKAIVKDIADLEVHMKFCEKKVRETLITSQETSQLNAMLRAAYQSCIKEHIGGINAECEKLIKLLTAYDEDMKELNVIGTEIAATTKQNAPTLFNAQTAIQNENKYFVEAFYKFKSAKDLYDRLGVKV